MRREDFHKISSLKQLEAAQRLVEKDLRRRRRALDKDFKDVKMMFAPLGLANAGWHLLAPQARPLQEILLGWVRGLKKALMRRS